MSWALIGTCAINILVHSNMTFKMRKSVMSNVGEFPGFDFNKFRQKDFRKISFDFDRRSIFKNGTPQR